VVLILVYIYTPVCHLSLELNNFLLMNDEIHENERCSRVKA